MFNSGDLEVIRKLHHREAFMSALEMGHRVPHIMLKSILEIQMFIPTYLSHEEPTLLFFKGIKIERERKEKNFCLGARQLWAELSKTVSQTNPPPLNCRHQVILSQRQESHQA